MVANAYFSNPVRTQNDRGQTVVTGGPYRFMHHPGYVGTILFLLLSPLALGSWWGLIPGAL
ncbi:MAG: isoprenylcysteine carboxylmethyltransferase family protein, partial [Anaerolineae bacterium]|nr:isoprenylcysteine carboxylmethyltransferase family protein [Anaerolineae bacterium]